MRLRNVAAIWEELWVILGKQGSFMEEMPLGFFTAYILKLRKSCSTILCFLYQCYGMSCIKLMGCVSVFLGHTPQNRTMPSLRYYTCQARNASHWICFTVCQFFCVWSTTNFRKAGKSFLLPDCVHVRKWRKIFRNDFPAPWNGIANTVQETGNWPRSSNIL